MERESHHVQEEDVQQETMEDEDVCGCQGSDEGEMDLEQRKIKLRKVLEEKDLDHSGTIEPDEFKQCLPLMRFCPTEEDATFLARHFDTNGDGKLRIEEIIDNLHILEDHSVKANELKEAFGKFDRDHNGYIRQREFIRVLIYNDFMTVVEARQLFNFLLKHYDKDGDGVLNYTEFVEMFMSHDYQDRLAEAVDEYNESRRGHLHKV